MKNTILDTFCPTCSHELVHGVACDWRKPGECPYMDKKDGKQTTKNAYHGGAQIANSDEKDVILSNN
jgi:hypothetical protein